MAGTLTVTRSSVGGGIKKYKLAWTASSGGAVSGNPFEVRRGFLASAKFVPGTGAAAPTDLYDITLVDEDNVDLLDTRGVDLSATIGKFAQWDPSLLIDGTQELDLVVAGAGNATSGTVYLWMY